MFGVFNRHDSGSKDQEMIARSGVPKILEVSINPLWLAVETFKITPKMFYGLYSILVIVSGIAPACIYAFLRNKT